MKLRVFAFALFFACGASAQQGARTEGKWRGFESDSKVVFFGHNVTQTSYMLDPGACVLGLQISGCGLGKGISFATSPWLITDYGMHNLFVRVRTDQQENQQTSLQAAYFKTFRGQTVASSYDFNDVPTFQPGMSGYQMEAFWLQWIRSLRVNEHLIQHLNVSVQHYTDDRRPYSLRRPSMRDHQTQLNLSDLLEVRLNGPLYLAAELGVLDVFGRYPHIHTGSSLQWRGKNWMAHFGFSMNATVDAFYSAQRRDTQQHVYQNYRTYEDEIPDDFEKYDYGIHPEFSLQYYF